MNKLNIDDFIIHFKDKDDFEMNDIVDFYRSADEQIKSATVNWRIYSLVQKGVLQRVGRGKFRLGNSKIFIPEISLKMKSLNAGAVVWTGR
ncbi:hypothetical protein AGMMS50239_22190 [Bacteroidia bacterium]|nr:hypothetical protein AGMMS50239_22190 [Bacteroidia bacterium]